jgi:hypothetical protein
VALMIFTRSRLRSGSLALLVLAGGGFLVAGDVTPARSDFRKQIGSVGAIQGVVLAIDTYREEHKTNPPSLSALVPSYMRDARALSDLWGRPLHYYASETHYVLASLGRNGVPDGQQAKAGGFGPANDFDQDIVLIDGVWAQSPPDVDR